jgi:hypothetical protein
MYVVSKLQNMVDVGMTGSELLAYNAKIRAVLQTLTYPFYKQKRLHFISMMQLN